jgi:hypothetical protein
MNKPIEEVYQILTKEFLIEKRINKNQTYLQIAKEVGCSFGLIRKKVLEFGIKKEIEEKPKVLICFYCKEEYPVSSGWSIEYTKKRKYCSYACKKLAMLGKKRSEETKLKISEKMKVVMGTSEKRKQLSEVMIKQRREHPETCTKIGEAHKGEKCSFKNYKGGITPLYTAIRNLPENKIWIKQTFQRDNYTCQECGKTKCYLEVHHAKKAFCEILQEFLQQYNQFSPIDDKETLTRLAITYELFWDITNGKTLCLDCHNIVENKKIIRRI